MDKKPGKIFAKALGILLTRTTRWPNYPVRSGLIRRLDKEVERVVILVKANYQSENLQSGLVKAETKNFLDRSLSRCCLVDCVSEAAAGRQTWRLGLGKPQ